ncbi:hypothetical protein [Pseudomonas sp. Irchel s3f19]|uniref:hypothetical protein n=1 Tax=Pseudomonas sp. Irchel s3f19 TaxID=2009146 RepID=UPI000BA354B5|nr:hypothetical protein [Pseudomonas sp. Irchel s3f19]
MDKRIDPTLGKSIYQTANAYMATLAVIGSFTMTLAGIAKPFISPTVALAVVAVVAVLAFLRGGEYRGRVDEFLERANFMMLMKICAKAWPFWLSTMFLTGVGVGAISMLQYDTWKDFMSVGGVVGLGAQYLVGQLIKF